MSEITGLLKELRELPGVHGAAVSTLDGMMVEGNLAARFNADAVSGLASFLVSTTKRAMAEDSARPYRFVVHATHGKIIVVDIGAAFLVVVTDQFTELDPALDRIDDACRRLRRLVRLPSF